MGRNPMAISNYRTEQLSAEKVVEYINFVCKLMGVDLDYNKFKHMTESEKLQFLRDFKIEKINT